MSLDECLVEVSMNEYIPLKHAGTLKLPPKSEPNPIGEQFAASRPPSPPLDPPIDLSLFHGFSPQPNILFVL